MRFLRTVTALLLLLMGVGASAQTIGSMRLGVIGGFTSSDSNAAIFKTSSYSLYHAGVTFECPIVGGFAIQPSILYQVKGATLGVHDIFSSQQPPTVTFLDNKVGYVEVPVQIQWGPDLLAFRPYVFAEPFVGFGVNTSNRFAEQSLIPLEDVNDFRGAAVKRLEYGAAAGLGFEFSRFQISGRYFWNLGSLYDETGSVTSVAAAIKMAYDGHGHYNGFSISAAVFF